jgi:hypothetical protein
MEWDRKTKNEGEQQQRRKRAHRPAASCLLETASRGQGCCQAAREILYNHISFSFSFSCFHGDPLSGLAAVASFGDCSLQLRLSELTTHAPDALSRHSLTAQLSSTHSPLLLHPFTMRLTLLLVLLVGLACGAALASAQATQPQQGRGQISKRQEAPLDANASEALSRELAELKAVSERAD